MKIVLLRGLMREKRYWGNFLVVLQERLPDYELICIDLPGLGDQSNYSFPYRIEKATNIVRNKCLKHTGNSKFHILGLSLGGMIAMDWANKYPNEVLSLILINSSASNLTKPWERLKINNYKTLFNILKHKNTVSTREKEILKMVSNLSYDDPNAIKECIDIAETSSFKESTALRQIVAAALFKAPKNLQVPSLVLCSKEDKMVSYLCSIKLAEKFKSEVCIHKTAGHDLTLDDPEWASEKISSWIMNADK